MKQCKTATLSLVASWLLFTSAAHAAIPNQRVLVIAPHEDDDTIACAGVIRNAVNNGADIRLMLVTTGGTGVAARDRLKQTISAMSLLGMPQEKIIYLGYDQSIVLMCAYNNKDAPFAICPGAEGTQTFAPAGYITDFHTLRYGTAADNNRHNVLTDIRTVLDEFRPQDIFMPAHMERHPDHAAAAMFTTEAIIELKSRVWYSPAVHEYMIYREGLPQQSLNALETVSNVSANLDDTPYSWNNREALPVPKEMYAPLENSTNLKQLAYRKYLGAVEGYSRFIKADEVFWKKDIASLSYSASVSASSERSDRAARNVIDGVALGAPFTTDSYDGANYHDFSVHEWIANDASSGAYVQLSWHRPVMVNQVLLYDCPSSETQITAGELIFSDGLRIPVGALPNQGAPRVVDVPMRWVTWVKFKVSRFVGAAPGLAEFEVYGVPRAFPVHTISGVRDTAVQFHVTYPDPLALGNRLAWRLRGTDTWSFLWPDAHIKSGSYVINGLNANSAYELFLIYNEPPGLPRRLETLVTTTAPEPPAQPPECRNCTCQFEAATDTSITVTLTYPDSNAWGNRLIYSDLTTGEIRDWATPFAVHDGTYTITGLTPKNMYNIDVVYLDETQPAPWIDNIYTAGTLRQ